MKRRQLLQSVSSAWLGCSGLAHSRIHEGLHTLAQRSGRSFGFAIHPSYASGESVKALLAQHAGVITAENAMKWRNIEGFLGGLDYTQADSVMALATRLNAKVRGHTLAWHQSTPLRLRHASPHVFAAEQTAYLQAMAGRYAGRIHTWDVLNEVIEPDHGRSDGMRESVMSALWGVDKYPVFFELARGADPLAKLAYNDYGMEQDEPWCERRRTVMLRTLYDWKKCKTPIDVLGLQAHLDLSRKFSATRLTRFFDEIRAFGMSIQITELDVRDTQTLGDLPTRDAAVAALYKDFVDVCVNHASVEMIVMWNVTDGDSWVNRWLQGQRRTDGQPMRPTLFDAHGQAKPAFDAFANSLSAATVKFDKKDPNRV